MENITDILSIIESIDETMIAIEKIEEKERQNEKN